MAGSGLRIAVRVGAVASVLATLGASVAAGVVQLAEEPETAARPAPGPEPLVNGPDPFAGITFDESSFGSWATQNGPADAAGTVVGHRIPPGWRVEGADYVVEARSADGEVHARGFAPAFYYGNTCRDGGQQVAGAWTVLAEPVPGDDLVAAAERAIEVWGIEYASNDAGVTAPMSPVTTEDVRLADGGPAARSRVTIDMTVFEGPCLPDRAELAVTTIATEDGVSALVQGRYLGVDRGLSDRLWAGISASLRQSGR